MNRMRHVMSWLLVIGMAFQLSVPTSCVGQAPADTPDPAAENQTKSVPDLIQQLLEEDTELQIEAARRLRRLGPQAKEALPALRERLLSDEAAVRVAVMRTIAAMGDEAKNAIPAIADLLADRAPIDQGEVWIVAAETLGSIGGEATLEAVMPLLVPSDEDVRYRAACLVLYTMGEEAAPALPTLVEILEAQEEPLGPPLYSVEGMGVAGAEAVPALIPLLDHENFHYQYFVCKVLGAIGEPAKPAVPKLIDRLKNGLPSVRRHAATALGNIGPASGEGAVAALTAALSDPLAPVRQDAAKALGQFGSSARSAAPALKEAVEDPGFPARVDAAASLWKIDPSHQDLVVKTLFEELEGDNEAWTAARELGLLAEEAKIVARILGMLDSATPEMKEQIVEMVGWLGTAGRPALDSLRAIRADESAEPDLREAAREAIERIETNRSGD